MGLFSIDPQKHIQQEPIPGRLKKLTDSQLIMLALMHTDVDCGRPSCIDSELACRVPLSDEEHNILFAWEDD